MFAALGLFFHGPSVLVVCHPILRGDYFITAKRTYLVYHIMGVFALVGVHMYTLLMGEGGVMVSFAMVVLRVVVVNRESSKSPKRAEDAT